MLTVYVDNPMPGQRDEYQVPNNFFVAAGHRGQWARIRMQLPLMEEFNLYYYADEQQDAQDVTYIVTRQDWQQWSLIRPEPQLHSHIQWAQLDGDDDISMDASSTSLKPQPCTFCPNKTLMVDRKIMKFVCVNCKYL